MNKHKDNQIDVEPTTVKGKVNIATHNGPFHADDAMAVAILLSVISKGDPLTMPGSEAAIIRTRDPDVIGKADFVVDVGGVHASQVDRFDHHQKGGAGARWDTEVPYAATGLVWDKYGATCVAWIASSLMKAAVDQYGEGVGGLVHQIAAKVDEELISPIDAADTGHASYGGHSISRSIAALNPNWMEPEKSPDECFGFAVEECCKALERSILNATAEEVAKIGVKKAMSASPGSIVVLDQFLPWQETVCEDDAARLVVFPSHDGDWMVQVVPVSPHSFEARLPLPEGWAGLRDKELDAETGIDGCVFCHPGAFICGHKTKDGAIAMAKLVVGDLAVV